MTHAPVPLQIWIRQIPNQLTIARMLVAPLVLFFYPLDIPFLNMICAVVFLIASVTDFFDGFLARLAGTESKLGAMLDPIADKILTTAGLVVLAAAGRCYAWMVGFLLCRDFLVSGLRMAAFQQKFEVEVSWFGKFKTLLLDTAIVCLMINERLWDIPFRAIGMLTLWLSLILSLYSAWLYIRVFAKGMVQPQP